MGIAIAHIEGNKGTPPKSPINRFSRTEYVSRGKLPIRAFKSLKSDLNALIRHLGVIIEDMTAETIY